MMPAMALPSERPAPTSLPAARPQSRPFAVVLLATDLSPTSMPAEDEAVRLAAEIARIAVPAIS